MEDCSFAGNSFCPYPSTMPVNDSFHQSKANTTAFNFYRGMQSLKHFEDLFFKFLIKTNPIIFYAEKPVVFLS